MIVHVCVCVCVCVCVYVCVCMHVCLSHHYCHIPSFIAKFKACSWGPEQSCPTAGSWGSEQSYSASGVLPVSTCLIDKIPNVFGNATKVTLPHCIVVRCPSHQPTTGQSQGPKHVFPGEQYEMVAIATDQSCLLEP